MNRLHVKYVLVGGGLASSAAAQAIRPLDPEGSILLIAQEVNRPYHRPPLSKDYLLGLKTRSDLYAVDDLWFASNHVELRTGRHASRLDANRSSVTLDTGEEISFDRLLIATGGSPRPLRIPGAELPNLLYLRTIEDADRLRHAMEKSLREGHPHSRGRGRACIIGAGRLGAELASTLTQAGLAVDLVYASPWPWTRFVGEATGRFLARYLLDRGVTVHAQQAPQRLTGDGRVQHVVLSEGTIVDCDLAVAAIGIVPHKEILRHTSIAAENSILVDEQCRTSDPSIYAAGDCAALLDPLFGKYRVMDHWGAATTIGALAGRNMAGANEQYSGVNHFTSTIFDLSLSGWGEAKLAERRLVRGQMSLDGPDFVEIGVAADGRICQVIAVNHAGEDDTLRGLVAGRVNVTGREQSVADPGVDLRSFLD